MFLLAANADYLVHAVTLHIHDVSCIDIYIMHCNVIMCLKKRCLYFSVPGVCFISPLRNRKVYFLQQVTLARFILFHQGNLSIINGDIKFGTCFTAPSFSKVMILMYTPEKTRNLKIHPKGKEKHQPITTTFIFLGGGGGCFSFGGTVQYIEESNIYLCFVVCRLKEKRGLVT